MKQTTPPADLKELHATLLDLIEDVDALCRRHNLRYSIYCGTLLGAVRERDFIPWDDDADLTMPIKDYRRFIKIAQQELSDKYVIQDLENTPQHPWLYMRVYRKGTTYMRDDRAALQICHGIAVDIFPMIGIANTKIGFRLQRAVLDLVSALHRVEFWKTIGYPKSKGARYVGKLFSALPRRLRHVLSLGLFRLACFSPQSKKKCCSIDSAPLAPKFDSADWNDYTTVDLAGKSFVAPVAYDKLLRAMYGDYMTPPPLAARTAAHTGVWGGVTFDPRRDYTLYRTRLLRERNAEIRTPASLTNANATTLANANF